MKIFGASSLFTKNVYWALLTKAFICFIYLYSKQGMWHVR